MDTVLFHVDALTGEDARDGAQSADVLQGEDIVAGPLVEAFLLHTASGRVIVCIDEFLQVYPYPSSDETTQALAPLLPALRIPLRTGAPGQRRLTGHQVPPTVEFTGKHVAYPTWTLPFPPVEDVRAIFARPAGPVASLGKVLGNRTTLYKYLNPNLVGVVTGPRVPSLSESAACSIYLVDGAKGTVVYHAVLPAVAGACDVKATLVENWLVYHYYDGDVGVGQAKGYRVVSVELYEGYGVDDKRRRCVSVFCLIRRAVH